MGSKRNVGSSATSTVSNALDDSGGGTFRVVERVMALLGNLARHPEGLTLTELSREAGLHKATTARFLSALDRGRFVAQVSTGKSWKLGPAFFEIGARALGQTDLREVARPHMERSCHDVGETVQLAILADDGVVYIEKFEPPDLPLKINTQIGSRRPIHCTGLGKVIAAYRDWNEIKSILSRSGMKRMTAQTILDIDGLKTELARIRKKGYAIDDREYNDLVVCVAAPVRNASGDVVAGLSISTFGVSVASSHFKKLTDVAVRTAAEVSAALGWHAIGDTGLKSTPDFTQRVLRRTGTGA